MVSPLCVSLNELYGDHLMKMPSLIEHNGMVYLSSVCVHKWKIWVLIPGISLITHSALIWLLTSVHLHVFMKTTFQRKWLATLAAQIWLLPCVNLKINCKMTIWGKSLVTLATMKWFLSIFCSHMKGQWHGFSSLCIFMCSSRQPSMKMPCYIGCTNMVSPLRESSNEL